MSKAACVQRAFVRRSAIIGTTLVLVILTAQPVLANPMSIGPQAMEGNVNVKPGDFIAAGYFLDVPGSHLAVTVQLANAQVAFVVSCVTGSGGGSIIIPLAPGPYNIPQNSDAVFPTNDQSSPASYQGSIASARSLQRGCDVAESRWNVLGRPPGERYVGQGQSGVPLPGSCRKGQAQRGLRPGLVPCRCVRCLEECEQGLHPWSHR